MKRIVSLFLAVVLCAAMVAGSSVTANGCGFFRTVYFVKDRLFQGEPISIYYWGDMGMSGYEWPGMPMSYYGVNAYGEDVYKYELPNDVDIEGFIISDGNGVQTCDITDMNWSSVLVTVGDETNEWGHYSVNLKDIEGLDPLDPETVPEYHGVSRIVFENNRYDLPDAPDNHFEDPIYICCRSDEDQEVTLRAQMELFAPKEGHNVYRFTIPEGMKYYYVTDGKKRTEELSANGTEHFYLDGKRDENGDYNVIRYIAGCVSDPLILWDTSDTTFDRFSKAYANTTVKYPRYEELYTHRDAEGAADWVLFYTESDKMANGVFESVIGNRFVQHLTAFDAPFVSHYGLYDVAQDTFVTVDSSILSRYQGLAKVFDDVGTGRLFGDLDGDDCLSVIDVTIFRRCVALMCDYPEDDEVSGNDLYAFTRTHYFSDFNRDDVRDLIDATCMQRYLAEMPY
ncbi:starch-binding protein [Ruminococcus sp.]|uniref:starch-binding protein n=1 Tax=Ruminococcus sp. TaxID=41978 RepID=UPI00388FE6A4